MFAYFMEGDESAGLVEEVGEPDDELRMELRLFFKHSRQKQEHIEPESENDADQQTDGQFGTFSPDAERDAEQEKREW